MKKNKVLHSLVTVFFLLAFASVCCAAIDNSEQPVHLEADKADLNQTTGEHVFTGNVSVIQGTAKLYSAKALVKTDADQKLERAIAYGNDKTQAHFTTIRDKADQPIHAYANIITYFPKEKKLNLKGNAMVKQGTDQYRAPDITYDIEQKHVMSQADSKERISIIIHPNLHKKAKS